MEKKRRNCWVIPTDKPSRLILDKDDSLLHLQDEPIFMEHQNLVENQNIYITNDEEIQRDWFISLNDDESFMEIIKNNEVVDFSEYADEDWVKNCQKIILTTDQDLIQDGVQAIDDEFLEWFVKNPSCEVVKVVEKQHFEADKSKRKNPLNGVYYSYKTIIPKEEPKQDLEKEIFDLEQELDIPSHLRWHNSKPKQETLEEAANRLLYNKYPYHPPQDSGYWKDMFKEGAKWQAERMYSEEDLKEAFQVGFNVGYNDETSPSYLTFEVWFEQFKKKV